MEKKDKSNEKFSGGMLGLLIGDILAFPLGMLDYERRKGFFPVNSLIEPQDFEKQLEEEANYNSNLKNRVENWFPAGYYSFYGQQALLILDSIFQMKDIDIEDISQKLVKYSYPRDRISPLGIFRGYNRQFYDSVQNIANGMPLKLCGVTNSIGDAPFKLIPIGMFKGFETQPIRDRSVDITLLTNRDIQAVASSAAIAITVAQTVNKSFFNVDEELKRIIDFTRSVENYAMDRFGDFFQNGNQNRNRVSNCLNELYRLKNESVDEGIRYFKNQAHQNNQKYNSSLVTTGAALLIFIKNVGSFEQAIKCAIEQDVDIQIVTPIVGALSGSLHGTNKLPHHWKNLVKYRKEIYQKIDYIKTEDTEKPGITNYYIREIELSSDQQKTKDNILNKIDEKLPVIA
jgi:ADP-ribosylglycohydrolase